MVIVPLAHGQWIQHAKLVGTGAVAPAGQGFAVALSADGHTALVGGPYAHHSAGAAWVFTRNGDVWTEQAKLVSHDAVGAAMEGFSVALSANGNTALVGGPNDNGGSGAAWVWQRSGTAWTQQRKLVANGEVREGYALQGFSVAISGDGDMALVGGPRNHTDPQTPPGALSGSAWVWTRSSGGIWSQQGPELHGTRAVPWAIGLQGASVALSGDGNTALVGGGRDVFWPVPLFGTAWVWARSRDVWTQQKLLAGTAWVDAPGLPEPNLQSALRVAISGDGNTAVAGGPEDDHLAGAAWIWTLRRGDWTQQGSKLAAAGVAGARQGAAVALSQDGSTAIIGGESADHGVGAAWLWTRVNGVWTEGPKLVGAGFVGPPAQGRSVALSASAGTALIGGPADDNGTGAVWVFIVPGIDSPGQGRPVR